MARFQEEMSDADKQLRKLAANVVELHNESLLAVTPRRSTAINALRVQLSLIDRHEKRQDRVSVAARQVVKEHDDEILVKEAGKGHAIRKLRAALEDSVTEPCEECGYYVVKRDEKGLVFSYDPMAPPCKACAKRNCEARLKKAEAVVSAGVEYQVSQVHCNCESVEGLTFKEEPDRGWFIGSVKVLHCPHCGKRFNPFHVTKEELANCRFASILAPSKEAVASFMEGFRSKPRSVQSISKSEKNPLASPLDEKLDTLRYCIEHGHDEDAQEHLFDLLRGLRGKSLPEGERAPEDAGLIAMWFHGKDADSS